MYAKYTTSPGNRGFRASHSNIAVLQFSIIGRGNSCFLPLSDGAIWRTAFQPVSHFLMYAKYATSPRGCGLSCSSSKYRRFTVFKQRAGETPASCPYPTALFGEQPLQPVSQFLMCAKHITSPGNRGFRASHPNIAVLPSKVIVQGKLLLLASIQPRYSACSHLIRKPPFGR